MGLFDRFKKNTPEVPPPEWPRPPREDTMALLLMDRVLPDIGPAAALLQKAFGDGAVSSIDRSHPGVPAFTVTVDALEFWCSCLPMPVPREEQDIPARAQYNQFLSPEEREAFCSHKSFLVIAQKGGGRTPEGKRRVCWSFSLICAALLELEGAVGVSAVTTALLVSRENYLRHCARMKDADWNDRDYFPVPLWIRVYQGRSGERPTVETQGLSEFGLPELGFFDPQLPVGDILNYLFTMASWQVTGRQLYRNRAVIPLTDEIEVVCMREGDKLYFIGA